MTALTQVIVVNSVAEMRQLDVSQFADGQLVTLLRYWKDYDGGGGTFAYSAAAGTTDGGVVFTPLSGPGCFARLGAAKPVLKGRGEGLDAEWFGAIGDRISHPLKERFASLADAQGNYPEAGSLDEETDRMAIQAALDYALQHHIYGVRLANGEFILDDTLHLGYGTGNGFSTVALTGAGTSTDNGGTVLLAQFKDRPAIAVQGARYSAVRSLSLEGANLDYAVRTLASATADILTNRDIWIDPALLADAPHADSQHAPYAGIAIDPYSGPAPADAYPPVAYPSWLPESDRAQYGKTTSSAVQIENVQISGFVVGIVNQPCEFDQQGDFTKIHKCQLQWLKYAISVGNGEARNTSIRDCGYDYVYTFLTNNTHGSQSGQLNGPIDNVGGGTSFQFADIYLNHSGPVRFSNIYFEDQIKFGTVGMNASLNSPVIFEGCMFVLAEWETGYNPDFFIGTSAYTVFHFTGCSFTAYGKFLNLTSDPCRVIFDSCTFTTSYYQKGVIYTPAEITVQNYLCGGVFCLQDEDFHGGLNPEIRGGIHSLILSADASGNVTAADNLYTSTVPGRRVVVHQGAQAVSRYPGNFRTPILVRRPAIGLGKTGAAHSPSGGTLTFTASGQNNYLRVVSPGDLLADSDTKTLFVVTDVTAAGGDQATVVAEIATNYHTSGGSAVPNADPEIIVGNKLLPGAKEPGIFILVPCSAFNTKLEYRGTTSQGSSTITEVTPPAAYAPDLANDFREGDILFFTDQLWGQAQVFPPATRITSINAQKGEITVDHNALINTTGYPVTVGFLAR